MMEHFFFQLLLCYGVSQFIFKTAPPPKKKTFLFEMKGPVRAFSVDSDAEAKSVTELILTCE